MGTGQELRGIKCGAGLRGPHCAAQLIWGVPGLMEHCWGRFRGWNLC